MYSSTHVPVLLEEISTYFCRPTNNLYIDGTLGFGGHAEAILDSNPSITTFVGIDMDPIHLEIAQKRLEKFSSSRNLIFEHSRFEHIEAICKKHKIVGQVTSILLDFGMCSGHIDNSERGFSIATNGPLDMRFDTTSHQTAASIIATASVEELTTIIRTFGEERHAKKIAQTIVKVRANSPIVTTFDLRDVIQKIFPPHRYKDPLLRTFQALRIAINEELQQIETAVRSSIELLAPSGILACISYHSLEDRVVKNIFKEAATEFIYESNAVDAKRIFVQKGILLTKKPIVPKSEEIEYNNRARSAKLRLFQKI